MHMYSHFWDRATPPPPSPPHPQMAPPAWNQRLSSEPRTVQGAARGWAGRCLEPQESHHQQMVRP